ncbi:MAG: M20/M25/M40 family metallo-hydrolase [Actinomycetota bacterium]
MEQLEEWLRIPSMSSGGGRPEDLEAAANWAAACIADAGGTADVLRTFENPLVIGRLRSREPDAPTVMIYGHYDVQSADPVSDWESPPFEPTIRGDRLYARGASDDKGNFFPLLYVACEMAEAGELPVNVRVLIEGAEETGGQAAVDWLAADDEPTDAAIVFDSDMLDEKTPALTLGARGIVMFGIEVRTAPQDLHSGMYGGSVLNALHVVHQMVAAVLPGPDGRLPEPLRAGIVPAKPDELDAWAKLPPGDEVIAEVGGRPLHDRAGAEYYERNWGDASVDVHGIAGGDAAQIRTQVPSSAQAKLSIRLAPGQTVAAAGASVRRLLEDAIPPGAEVKIEVFSKGEPALFSPDSPAIRLAAEALEAANGVAPVLTRVGGSLPVLSVFSDRGIPAIVSGYALPLDGIHGPNESFRLESLRLGLASARALYNHLASLRDT